MKILLPLDGLANAESTLPLARSLARRWKASLVLVRACDPGLSVAPDLPASVRNALQQRSLAAAQAYLESKILESPDIQTSCHCPLELPRNAIPRLADEEGCDVILMATHGRSGPERWIMGSVTESVLRRSHKPVLMVKMPACEQADFRNVLIPLDGSEPSLRAVEHVTPYLSNASRVTLLQCSGLDPEALGAEVAPEVIQHYLDQMAVRLREVQVPGHQPDIVVCHGSPVETIVDWATEQHCDLIVMSTEGRTGRPDSDAHRWLGSVTEKVARLAPCAVLACPRPGRQG